MQEKFSILAIVAVISTVFTTTLALSLTSANAVVCSPRSGACASTGPPTQGHIGSPKHQAISGSGANSPYANTNLNPPNQAFTGNPSPCVGPGVDKNGHITCAS